MVVLFPLNRGTSVGCRRFLARHRGTGQYEVSNHSENSDDFSGIKTSAQAASIHSPLLGLAAIKRPPGDQSLVRASQRLVSREADVHQICINKNFSISRRGPRRLSMGRNCLGGATERTGAGKDVSRRSTCLSDAGRWSHGRSRAPMPVVPVSTMACGTGSSAINPGMAQDTVPFTQSSVSRIDGMGQVLARARRDKGDENAPQAYHQTCGGVEPDQA